MSRKLTISLTDQTFSRLGQWVQSHDSNCSVVIEGALIRFSELEARARERTIRELHASRKATSREGWVRLFWEALAEEFDVADFDSTGRRLMAVRQYAGFNIIYLVQQPANDDRRIHLQVQEAPPHVHGIETLAHYYQIAPEDSAYRTAAQIAAWIREQQARASELRTQREKLSLQPAL